MGVYARAGSFSAHGVKGSFAGLTENVPIGEESTRPLTNAEHYRAGLSVAYTSAYEVF